LGSQALGPLFLGGKVPQAQTPVVAVAEDGLAEAEGVTNSCHSASPRFAVLLSGR
jgi:hypothetical protein